jgi:hypothetical protein
VIAEMIDVTTAGITLDEMTAATVAGMIVGIVDGTNAEVLGHKAGLTTAEVAVVAAAVAVAVEKAVFVAVTETVVAHHAEVEVLQIDRSVRVVEQAIDRSQRAILGRLVP